MSAQISMLRIVFISKMLFAIDEKSNKQQLLFLKTLKKKVIEKTVFKN
jgi:hypothetical protein